jgi:UDP-3-O-[3-hydroxymyristoyl] glucosamine N-acyltransferase
VAIVANTFEAEKPLPETLTLVRVPEPRECFAKLLAMYEQLFQEPPGIHPSAVIDPSAEIGDDVYIGPNSSVGKQARIGNGVRIHSNVTIGPATEIGEGTQILQGAQVLHRCSIGKHCTIHPGAIIGSDGFGFTPNSENNYARVPQIGTVILEDHVDIGAGTIVDRATLGATRICRGVKLDNLIQIAHNVEIGENTVIAAQTGIAGSTKIGKNCMIGGQVGIVGHIQIADEVKIAAQSGIANSIETPGTIVQGSPAIPIVHFKKAYIGFRNLPDMQRELAQLRKEFNQTQSGE